MARLMAGAALDAGLDVLALPDAVRVRDTDLHRFVFNYGAEEAPADAVPGLDAPIPPAGLARLPLRT